MPPLTFTIAQASDSVSLGLRAIQEDHPERFTEEGNPVALTVEPDDSMGADSFRVQAEAGTATITFGSPSAAFRALGEILAAEDETALAGSGSSAFTMRGLMVDCSRNGVMTPDALKAYMRRVALMGVNMIMLYTEDTYEVPDEPYFGYLRGRYTQEELRDIDDYADALGIEIIPCIQTLGHLGQILQWDEYFDLRDTANVLLAEHEESYELIRKIIRAASGPLRSNRIHLGMDEAHGLGTGRYKDLKGEKRPFDIMNAHLARVRDICRDEGLQPMIWSDMYFRLGSKDHGYYDLDWSIPSDVVQDIPKDVQQVYWDYYHEDPEFYRKMIAFHRQLGSEPVMGGGIWTWSHFWCAMPWAFTAVKACMTACRQEGLKEVFMTLWGDDGMEVDIFSSLPGIQYFCDHAFSESPDSESTRKHFRAVCESEFDAWVRAAQIDSIPTIKDAGLSKTNVSKGLLWEDPLLALLDPQVDDPRVLRRHYNELSDHLSRAATHGGLSERLTFPARIAKVLALKVGLRRNLAHAYRDDDTDTLQRIVDEDLPELRDALDELWNCHRAMWMDTYKPFGWEVIEHRYGGLHARLVTTGERVSQYLQGSIDSIPELEAEIRDAWPHPKGDLTYSSHSKVKTPSMIK